MSQMITDKSLKKNWISNDQREICCYAIERRLGSTLFLLLLLLVALVAGEFLRTISFVSVFFVFRRRMGGWHANSALLCFILSLSIVLISIFFIGPAAERLPFSVILSVNILFSVILFILPPAAAFHGRGKPSQYKTKEHPSPYFNGAANSFGPYKSLNNFNLYCPLTHRNIYNRDDPSPCK